MKISKCDCDVYMEVFFNSKITAEEYSNTLRKISIKYNIEVSELYEIMLPYENALLESYYENQQD